MKNTNPRRRGRARGPHDAAGADRTAVEPLHPVCDAPQVESFHDWDLAPEVQRAIEEMGIVTPTPIQALAVGPALEGRDVIAKAETGTGKTLAFGAPLISRLDSNRASVLALVLCPTRELAHQVFGVLQKLGEGRGLTAALIVGGEPMHPQIDALRAGAQVVVGTPGRVLDLYGQRFLSFPWTEVVVLDEADEMLEIGFIDDVRKILSFTPEERQTMLFSATFPKEVLTLARWATRDPAEVATAAGLATVDTIEQTWIPVEERTRTGVLVDLIDASARDDVFLVFCDRRTEVDALLRRLAPLRHEIKALHGGYDQPSRVRVMGAFRTGEVKALLATDVASRGLDIHHVTHVVNYSVPQDISDYTHRIGRTGRAGRSGRAITLVTPRETGRWRAILQGANWPIDEARAPSGGRRNGRERGSARPESDRGERPARSASRRGRGDGERAEGGAGERRRRAERPERERRPERRERGRSRPAGEETRGPQRGSRGEEPRAAAGGERPRRRTRRRGRGGEEATPRPERGERAAEGPGPRPGAAGQRPREGAPKRGTGSTGRRREAAGPKGLEDGFGAGL